MVTRPDPEAVAIGVSGAIWTAALICWGWKIPAAVAAAITVAAVIHLWHVPGEDDLMAVADATRDAIPDYVPDEWTEEFRQ